MPIKSVKMKISKNKKMRFFVISQGYARFLAQKLWSVARVQRHRQTHRHTDRHESDYRGHPFRVSGVFPSPYHQGSAQFMDQSASGPDTSLFPSSTDDSMCGSTFTNTSGTILSPNYAYDVTYPNNLTCDVIISASPGHVVQVSFEVFEIQQDSGCSLDSVQVRAW